MSDNMINSIDFYEDILENLFDGVYVVNSDRKILYWNKGSEFISGYTKNEVIGSHCWDDILMHVDENGKKLCNNLCPLVKTIIDGKKREKDVFLHHKEGYRIPVTIRAIPIKDSEGIVSGAIEIFMDRSDTTCKNQVKELKKAALADTLTELPNRRYCEDQIHNRIQEYKNYGRGLGILFIDIDIGHICTLGTSL